MNGEGRLQSHRTYGRLNSHDLAVAATAITGHSLPECRRVSIRGATPASASHFKQCSNAMVVYLRCLFTLHRSFYGNIIATPLISALAHCRHCTAHRQHSRLIHVWTSLYKNSRQRSPYRHRCLPYTKLATLSSIAGCLQTANFTFRVYRHTRI